MKWRFESADAAGAYAARNGLLSYLQSRAEADSDLEGAAIVFGELIANVARHAPGPIAIDVSWEGGLAVLSVSDRGPGFQLRRDTELPEVTAESGRGLFICNAIARSLEVTPLPGGGCTVTACLPVRLQARFRSAS